jgi:hypothetical protein
LEFLTPAGRNYRDGVTLATKSVGDLGRNLLRAADPEGRVKRRKNSNFHFMKAAIVRTAGSGIGRLTLISRVRDGA